MNPSRFSLQPMVYFRRAGSARTARNILRTLHVELLASPFPAATGSASRLHIVEAVRARNLLPHSQAQRQLLSRRRFIAGETSTAMHWMGCFFLGGIS
jgi:hypothetical protein